MECSCIYVRSSTELVLLLLALVVRNQCQTTFAKTAVEGVSRNINILCDLDRQFHPLYWKINDLIYDQYNVPQIFTVVGHEALVISEVDRRMDGWRFQCFTVNPSSSDGLTPGFVTILTIIYDMSIEGPGNADVLQPSTQAILLFYSKSLFGSTTTTLSWLYPVSNSLCVTTKYNVSIYTKSDIDDATTEGYLMSLFDYTSTEERIELPSSSLYDNYFNISASNVDSICTTSEYFYSTFPSEINEDIYVNQDSASFIIPEELRNNRSLQLIWSTAEDTQCVCPPVEQFMSTCACNINATNNQVTITNNQLVVSNLTQNMMTFYFASSVSSGCHGNCNLQSMAGVYNIFMIQEALSTLAEHNLFCFSNNGSFSPGVMYEVNLTDSTGSLTPLSGIYSNPECLSIGPSLYPDVCGPFQLSVVAISQVGRSAVQYQTVLPDNELNSCYCYREKENIEVDIVTVNSTSAQVVLTCGFSEYRSDNILTLVIIQTEMDYSNITTSCNSTKVLTSLMPSTEYIINITTARLNVSCTVQNLTTKAEDKSTSTDLIIILSSLLISITILFFSSIPWIVMCILRVRVNKCKCFRLKYCRLKCCKNYSGEYSKDEDSTLQEVIEENCSYA